MGQSDTPPGAPLQVSEISEFSQVARNPSKDQKQSRIKAKRDQKPEQERYQKLAKDVLMKPSDKEGAAATIQPTWISRQEGTVHAKKVNAQIVVDNSLEANNWGRQTSTHTGREKKAIPSGRE